MRSNANNFPNLAGPFIRSTNVFCDISEHIPVGASPLIDTADESIPWPPVKNKIVRLKKYRCGTRTISKWAVGSDIALSWTLHFNIQPTNYEGLPFYSTYRPNFYYTVTNTQVG